jgi:Flp pilus assembly protein TadG
MMRGHLFSRLRRNESGASIIEFALLAPVLLFLLVGAVTLFDLFRTQQSVEKATFTVGDMLSRAQVLTENDLDNMLVLLRNIVPAANEGGLRISSIVKSQGSLVVRWSEPVGTAVPSTPLPTSILPDIAEGDSVLLTESFVPYQAFMTGFGLDFVTFTGQSAHRPRVVSSITFQ